MRDVGDCRFSKSFKLHDLERTKFKIALKVELLRRLTFCGLCTSHIALELLYKERFPEVDIVLSRGKAQRYIMKLL